jgi:glyoxylase-like metal-dependent hydrolase (beta-lactamase superfamily II)
MLWAEDAPGAVVIDPGGDADRIAACIQARDRELDWIVATHGHGDHIGANAALKERWPAARVAAHPLEAPMLRSPLRNLSVLFGASVRSPEAEVLLKEGDTVECGPIRLRVLHTPGHTPGSISLILDGEPAHAFTGDLLFAGGVGRTDFPGGDFDALQHSIREKILVMPDETILHPGHPPETTVGRERRTNPYLEREG